MQLLVDPLYKLLLVLLHLVLVLSGFNFLLEVVLESLGARLEVLGNPLNKRC